MSKDIKDFGAINTQRPPRFLPSPDPTGRELYITCTAPLALIWVRQTTPTQFFILEGPQEEQLLCDAADWWRQYGSKFIGGN